MSEHIWLINNGLGLKLYVKEENLEVVAHNYFIAGGDRLVMMELEGVLGVNEEPRPLQTVIIDNLMGFAEWRESIPKQLEKP